MERKTLWFDSLEHLIASTGSGPAREAARLASCSVTHDSPIDIWLERDMLIAVVQASVRKFQQAARRKDTPEAVRDELADLIAQRKAFVTWLRAEKVHVYVRLSPTATMAPVERQPTDG